ITDRDHDSDRAQRPVTDDRIRASSALRSAVDQEDAMRILQFHRSLSAAAVAATMLGAPIVNVPLAADTRQVSIESLLYDLKHPDPLRRQSAARELGAAKYRPATPQLVPLANDPVAAVRREVELS